MAPGTSVKLGVIRQGQTKTLTLTLGTLPNARSEGKHTVLFRVKSGDGMKFVALPLGNA
jgi:hypothetical protein